MSNAAISRCAVVLLAGFAFVASNVVAQGPKFDSDTISGLGARNIGSAEMSGRISALAAVKENGRLTVYVGSASGGVWKSVNGSSTFKPVFDKEAVQSIDAVAVDPTIAQDHLGRHRRILDPQQRLYRRRHLPLDGRW